MKFRPRFSLRAMLISIALACLALGLSARWYRLQVIECRRQQAIADRLMNANAGVGDLQPEDPEWMGEWLYRRNRATGLTYIVCVPATNVELALDEIPNLPTLQKFAIRKDVDLSPATKARIADLQKRFPKVEFGPEGPDD
jgi:hypothetical protein